MLYSYNDIHLQLALRQAVRVWLHRAGPGQEDNAVAGLRQTAPQRSSLKSASWSGGHGARVGIRRYGAANTAHAAA